MPFYRWNEILRREAAQQQQHYGVEEQQHYRAEQHYGAEQQQHFGAEQQQHYGAEQQQHYGAEQQNYRAKEHPINTPTSSQIHNSPQHKVVKCLYYYYKCQT